MAGSELGCFCFIANRLSKRPDGLQHVPFAAIPSDGTVCIFKVVFSFFMHPALQSMYPAMQSMYFAA